MGPCAASVTETGALIASISGGGETLSVIPISNATNLNGVGAGMVGWQQVGTDTAETSSTTTVINATTHAARVGDILNFTAGTAGNIGVWSVVSAVGANTITLTNALPATPANGDAFSIMRPQPFYLQREDESSFSGALGVLGIGYTNEGQGTLNSVDGDWGSPAYTRRGNTPATLMYDPGVGGAAAAANQAIRKEDDPVTSADAGIGILTQRLDQLATGQTGSNNEYAAPIVDTLSRLYVNPWGAAVTEFSSSCSSAITGTSRTAIKAAVASNRIYTTSITCSNSGGAASIFNISDGAGAVLAVGALAATVGSYTASFPVPLRGSLNTDLSVTMNTTSTSTICCANGFISPY